MLNDMTNAVKYYKEVLESDNTHVEAISCIATNHFYSDQPEVALKFFRYVSFLCLKKKNFFPRTKFLPLTK